MKIILEKSDLLIILGKHFDTTLDESKVIIRPEGQFEVEITGVVMNSTDTPATKKAETPTHEAASKSTPAAAPTESMEDILAQSEKLARSDRNTLTAVPSDFSDEI